MAADSGSETVWVAILDDGRAFAFAVDPSGWRPVAVTPDRLPPGMPPLLSLAGGEAHIVTVAVQTASSLTHPAPAGGQNRMAYMDLRPYGI